MAISSVGATARDYVDLAAWVADLPATLLEQEVAELYNDSEFVSASGITVSGITTTASFNLTIRSATGEAFNDTEQALRYNAANGVAIRKSSNYGTTLTITTDNTHLKDIQIAGTGSNRTASIVFTGSTGSTVTDCLTSSATNARQIQCNSSPVIFVNTVINIHSGALASAKGVLFSYTAGELHNCTIVNLSGISSSFGVEKAGGAADSSIVKNTAIFGFATALETGTWGAGTDFNATDNATLPAGSNNQTSLTTADQFENVASDATLDLRLKAGNSLDGNGTPDALTNDLDIFGNARSVTTPSISAYETVSAGGISVTETLKNINYNSLDPVITLTGSLSIIESLVNSNYTALNPSITLTGVISITEQLKNTNYTSLDPIIDLTGLVDITENTVNTNYAALNATITLTAGVIEITEQVVNTQYNTFNPSILLTPEPLGIVSTVCFDGVLVNIEHNGIQNEVSFNGQSINITFNGNFNEIEFNGTIQTSCNPGSIKTNC